MAVYPIHIPRAGYRGKGSSQQARVDHENEAAAKIERYVNETFAAQDQQFMRFTYGEIAHATGYRTDLVSKLCYPVDCAGSGFMVVRPEPQSY